MNLGIRGKAALVAGSSSGIGEAVAKGLATEGANLLLCARRREELDRVACGIREASDVRVEVQASDLSSGEGCREVLRRLKETYGGADILVPNAGGPPSGGFGSLDEQRLAQAHRLTYLSGVRLIQGVLPRMRERKWGRIVAITSVSVFEPIPHLILSNAYRSALTATLKTLSQEAAADGVTVNTVCPGYTMTERLKSLSASIAEDSGRSVEDVLADWKATIPAARIGGPDEVAAAVVFLCSASAAYINGVALPVDGGRLKGLLS